MVQLDIWGNITHYRDNNIWFKQTFIEDTIVEIINSDGDFWNMNLMMSENPYNVIHKNETMLNKWIGMILIDTFDVKFKTYHIDKNYEYQIINRIPKPIWNNNIGLLLRKIRRRDESGRFIKFENNSQYLSYAIANKEPTTNES